MRRSGRPEGTVKLRPLEQWRPEMRALEDVIAEMSKNLSEIRGSTNFSQPIRDNVAENISGQLGQSPSNLRV